MAACKAATEVFPKWWRPHMIQAVSADADSRKEAEASFQKWVEAQPELSDASMRKGTGGP